MLRTRLVFALVATGLVSCSSDSSGPNSREEVVADMAIADLGADVGVTDDAEAEADAAVDLGGSGCLQATVSEFRVEYSDDVAVEYSTELDPEIGGVRRSLALLFERYGDATYQGTFELGVGADENFGTCAHCLYVAGDNPERAYFADRGTLVNNTNPYSRRLDTEVTNLRLIEVAVDPFTRSSLPIPDGECIEVADFTHQGTFPVAGWFCDDEEYGDGMMCNCSCGAVDPDCGGEISCLIGDPACTPREELPVDGCSPAQVCVFEPISNSNACASPCDWAARTGCDAGTCVYQSGVGNQQDLCILDGPRIAADVALGADCPSGGLQAACNVVDGFAEGYCGPNKVCRPLCESDAECTEAGETCRVFTFDNPRGYCGPEPVDG